MSNPKDLIAAELIALYARAFSRQGGIARAQKLTKERRIEIARMGGQAFKKKRLALKSRVA